MVETGALIFMDLTQSAELVGNVLRENTDKLESTILD
jgi:hypothetical protein